MSSKKLVMGWNEYVDLPDWNIYGLKAKVDTGAKTSSIHVDVIDLLPNGRIQFFVVLGDEESKQKVKVEAKIRRKAAVRSSVGQATKRLFVSTRICVGPIRRRVELNLVNRQNMKYRMLLGRTAFKEDFLVDAHHTYILTKPKRNRR